MNDKLGTPLCYTGNKTRILPLIHENLPEKYNIFVDMFGGSGVVGLSQDKPLIYNEKDIHIFNLIKTIKEVPFEDLLIKIDEDIEYHNLSKIDKNAYIQYRNDFNNLAYKFLDSENDFARHTSNIQLLVLCFYSFNHQITFNSQGKFSVPAGTNRSAFNKSIRHKLVEFKDIIDDFDYKSIIQMYNMDFRELYNMIVNKAYINLENYLFFVDPPYIVSQDIYSRTHGLKWTLDNEQDLYEILDSINNLGGKFILTNQLQKGDIKNEDLSSFSKKYNVINTNVFFDNSSYQRKNKGNDIEILVKNY